MPGWKIRKLRFYISVVPDIIYAVAYLTLALAQTIRFCLTHNS